MISIPRFPNEKKNHRWTILKITINFGTQIDLLCFKNRTKQSNQHVWLFYINVDNRVYEFGKKSNKKKIILLKA